MSLYLNGLHLKHMLHQAKDNAIIEKSIDEGENEALFDP
jgi:hypothetical protein